MNTQQLLEVARAAVKAQKIASPFLVHKSDLNTRELTNLRFELLSMKGPALYLIEDARGADPMNVANVFMAFEDRCIQIGLLTLAEAVPAR